jgi:cytochrome c oxidase subunit 2
MRERPAMVEKVSNINSIRAKNSEKLVAKGESPLDPYTFDFLLLCNKICGASHYNMQMKIVVDTPEDYKKWVEEKQSKTIVAAVKAAAAEAAAAEVKEVKPDTTVVATTKDTTLVAHSTEVK